MKLLLVSGSYPPMRCGVGDYSFCLASALANIDNVNVIVLTSIDAKKYNQGADNSVKVLPLFDGWRINELTKFIKVLRDGRPDLVHIQYPTQGYKGIFLPCLLPIVSFIMGKKVVQTWHEGFGLCHIFCFLLKIIIPTTIIIVRPNLWDELQKPYRWHYVKNIMKYIKSASTITRAKIDEQERINLRNRYLSGRKRLVVFFGFLLESKGVELLFDIAEATTDKIVIAGEIPSNSTYGDKIKQLASGLLWDGKVKITGFLPAIEIAKLLSVADAVVLPFRVGGGEWNTSIHAATVQGTFVLTTSTVKHGYDNERNIYYANIDDVKEMRTALKAYAGKKQIYDDSGNDNAWRQIAIDHYSVYMSH